MVQLMAARSMAGLSWAPPPGLRRAGGPSPATSPASISARDCAHLRSARRPATLIAKVSASASSGPGEENARPGLGGAAGGVGASLLALLSVEGAAEAITKQEVEDAYVKAEQLAAQVTTTAGSAFETARGIFDKVFTTLKPGLDAAAPYVQQTTESVTKAAGPLASDLVGEAQKALRNAGVNTDPGLEFAKQTSKVLEGAQPLGTSLVQSALNAGPVFLAEAAGGLLLVYYLAPPLVKGLFGLTRGYSGDLTAPQALDLLLKLDFALIDVRTEKEKDRSGVPSLPSNAGNKYLAVPLEEFSGKVKFQLRNSRKVEAEVAAIKIASLKRLNRGSRVVILDEYGDVAKTVARALRKQGFKNCFVITGGFKGGKGWVQSKLGTDDTSGSSAGGSLIEVLSPSRVIPAGSKKMGSQSSSGSSRFKMLPGGADD